MIDAARLKQSPIPPPVYVEGVRADRKEYAVGAIVRLPARSRDIAISYMGLSYSIPQKVRFRYKLEGRDREWQNGGTRRQVSYSDLPPRAYRFRVIASNNDGVWNEAGASLDFSIAPGYYQTASFRSGFVVAVLALVWATYTFRVRQLAHQFDARLQERVNERTRESCTTRSAPVLMKPFSSRTMEVSSHPAGDELFGQRSLLVGRSAPLWTSIRSRASRNCPECWTRLCRETVHRCSRGKSRSINVERIEPNSTRAIQRMVRGVP
jgi:hypothetical protein